MTLALKFEKIKLLLLEIYNQADGTNVKVQHNSQLINATNQFD